MIVNHSYGLHKSIANGITNKFKPSFFKGFTHGDTFRTGGSEFSTSNGFSSDELPNVFIKTSKFLLNLEVGLCIFYNPIDLESIANNSGILHKGRSLLCVVLDYFFCIKIIKNFEVLVPLFSN